MVKTTIGACASVLAALVFSLSVFAADDSTHWHWKYDKEEHSTDPILQESDWHPYCDAANWTIGTTGQNPQNRWPTQNDILYYGDYYSGIMAFDMGGNDISVYGIDDTYTHSHAPQATQGSWGYHKIILRNGSLTLNNCFTNTRTHFNVWSGGSAKLADSCKSRLGFGGASTHWYVHDGGYARLAGEADWINFDVDVFEGGLVDVDFARLTHIQASESCSIRNRGTLNFPHGLAMTGTPSSGALTISQNAGTMTIGGDMSKAAAGYGVNLYLNGGTVKFTGNSTLSGYSTALVSNAAPVTVDVDAGRTADYRSLQFSAGAQLKKTGSGTFIAGSGSPTSVTVSGGVLGAVGTSFGGGLSLASGTTLRLCGAGTSATAITGLNGATVDVDPNISSGIKVFTSSDATLLSSVLAKLQSSSGSQGTFAISGSDIVFTRSHAPSVFYWKGGTSPWASFNSAANWGVGTTAAATNPNNLVPSASDWIHYMYDYSFTLYWDLGNLHQTIKGFDFTDWPAKGKEWGFHTFKIRNGTLEISQNFTNQRVTVSLESNAKFILGPNSHTRLSQGDAQSWYTVKSGCEMVLGGYLELVIPMIEVFDGGICSFEPKELTAHADSFKTVAGHPDAYIRNHGTMNFPNGINYLRGGNEDNPGTLTIDNCAGMMTFGGSLVKGADANGIFKMLFNGGTVVFNQPADLRWFASVGSTNENSTTTIRVADGRNLYLPGGEYARGTKLIKEGNGLVSFGSGLPDKLQIKGGSLRLEGTGSVVDELTMSAGSTLTIAGPGTTINSFTGYDGINFEVDVEKFALGAIVLKSSNDTLLTKLKQKAVMPSGYSLTKSGSRLTLSNDSLGYVFNCLGEKQMNDPTGWTSGTVAPAGSDVIIKGGQTVAVLDNTMPVYKSISVMEGGTLKLKNLTAMPNLNLLYDAKVAVAEGTGLNVGLGQIVCEAEADRMPTFEISAKAKATFATEFEFMNMHLLLLGELQCVPPFFLGTVKAAETAYFSMAATNGAINVTSGGGGSGRTIHWMAPQISGGRVKSPKGISLYNVTFPPVPATVYFGQFIGYYNVGVQNPNDEKFDIVLDRTRFPILYNQANLIGAGARIRAINGGAVEKAPLQVSAPGTYGKARFLGAAEMVFEGENSWFGYYYNRYRVEAYPDVAGVKQMTFRNGASIRAPHFLGNGKAIYTFENGFFDVLELPSYDRAMWGGWIRNSTQYEFQKTNGGGEDLPSGAENWVDWSDLSKTNFFSAAFRGLKEVQVPANCKLGFRGVNWYGIRTVSAVPNSEPNPSASKAILYSNEWDRVIWTDDQVPITGGGSIYVCNTVSNQSMAAIIRCGQNTATGRAWAEEDTVGNGNKLYFADGANWAGTVVVNERLGFTNVAENARAANVTFNTMTFEGPLDIRVWKDDQGPTNDCVTILSSGFRPEPGCINPVPMSGYAPKVGDTFVIAQLPSGVPNMAGRVYLANKRWVLADETDPDSVRRLKLRYVPGGILLNFRGAPPPPPES